MKKLFFIINFSFFILNCYSQDSCQLRISLLTCAPGEELYSTFGHTALRVTDKRTGSDLVFNYGTFDFGPDFYTKFVQGKLKYYLSVDDFANFVQQYQAQSRSIIEQELNLSCAEEEKLFEALTINAREENKYYLYDFLFDNCTTRAKDIVAKNTNSPTVFHNILPDDVPSFRNLIHSYLDKSGQHWSKLGIDMLLGAKLDRKVSNEQAMFLPDYLLKGFDSARVGNHSIVSGKLVALEMPSPIDKDSFLTPFVVFSLLLILVVVLTFSQSKRIRTILKLFDITFFLVLGLTGFLMIFMWFGTDHRVTQNNYNLLWALPTNTFMAFLIYKSSNLVKMYFKVVFWISVLLLVSWFFLPQQMNNALLPVLLLIIFRAHLISTKNYAEKRS